MVNTLLDITEAESGVMRLSPEVIRVSQLATEVRDLYEMVAEERGITMRLDVPDDLEVVADRLRLRQVVANLVDNAVKYCREDGLVTIAARAIGGDSHGGAHGEDGHGHGDQEHGVIEISVSDTGPGLGDDERDRVWERMYRGPIQPDQRGLGLGLSLVRAVVSAHDGSVAVESEKGRGARFLVHLPAR